MKYVKSFVVAGICTALLSAGALAIADTDSAASGPTPPPASAGGQPYAHHGHHGMLGTLRTLGLTQQQQAQIKTLFDNYRKAHPKGSQPDPIARKQLRDQILAILTPDQRTKLQKEMQSWKAHRGETGQPSPAPSP